MARTQAPPFYHVHAEALAADALYPGLHPSESPPEAVSVEDWQQALDLSHVVVLQEEEELAEAPPDPTFADTEAVVVDASVTCIDAARAL